jgi:hypothetical protein
LVLFESSVNIGVTRHTYKVDLHLRDHLPR